MKHIIPTLTLTALAAAASAQQAAAPAGLNYNQVGLSRTSDSNTASAQFNPSGSNLVIGFATTHGDVSGTDYNYGQLNLGYVFKGLVQGVDATVGLIQTNGDNTVYTLTLRRALNEVYQGLEISAGIASSLTSSDDVDGFAFGGTGINSTKTARFVDLGYNLNKTFQVGVGVTQGDKDDNTLTVFSVRAGF